ncbi:porin [Ancylobacter dichloromethanicus]|uniref:Porin n=1 Tax=Ancylobacter dichloromethanicus TaxID=518825 RepID=A0A9W6MZD7_9HYPH|nr:porin [Ancylobacter dichloromethanicus]MBS7552665.1 porin [Ancylobacter dichloromethanicus]GLK72028.1 porin [Ancylobacter dichloromethanicus]
MTAAPVRAGAAALLAAVASLLAPDARAGDIPTSLTERYVRACKAQGPGFMYIPGSDTCLRLGGYLWNETYSNSYTDYPAANARTYWVSTFGLLTDARTRTEYGTLRSYTDLRIIWRTAEPWGEGRENGADFQPYDMHIEFAGFTFGYTQSFFDFYANADVMGTDPATVGDQTQLPVLGHSWSLPHGFAAQLSLEGSSARDQGILPVVASPGPTLDDDADTGGTTRWPEIVATFGQSGDWGDFLLSGALHQIAQAPVSERIGASTDDWGYALQAGVMFNLPFIATGDTLYLQAAYADGATSYLGLIDPSGRFDAPDAFQRLDGSLARVRGWSVVSQYLHNWSPRWNSAVFGGYGRFDIADPLAQITYGTSGIGNWNVGANLNWTPAGPFTVTLQYDYNLYSADDFRPSANGLPLASQAANQIMLMFAATF